MRLFPALNITGIARVELAEKEDFTKMLLEACTIFAAIDVARTKNDHDDARTGTIMSGHRKLCDLSADAHGKVTYRWSEIALTKGADQVS